MKITDDLITEIMERVEDLSDNDYCDVLEEVASACDDSANAKREEIRMLEAE